jgi:ATP-binding cassette, subfamily B, bacterial PglK
VSLVKDIWSVLSPRQRRSVAAAHLLSIAMAFSTVAGIASIAPFFSVLGDPELLARSRFIHGLYAGLGFSSPRSFEISLGLGFIIIVFAANAVNASGLFAMVRLSWQISTDLKSILLREYLSRPFLFHTKTNSATLLHNIIYETNMTTSMLQNMFILVTNLVTGGFIIAAVIALNPLLGAVMVGTLAGGYVLIYLTLRNRLLRAGQEQSDFHIEQTKTVNESLGAIKEIQLLGRQRFFHEQFEQSSRSFGLAASHTQLVSQAPKHIMECLAVAGLALVALLAAGRENGIGPWLGQLTFLGFAAYRLLPALQQAFAAVVGIRAARSGFAVIAPDVRAARVRVDGRNAGGAAWKERPVDEIRLANAYFRYASDAAPAIDGVSLRIPARAAAGFVGPNGSGKTTLIDIVAGLLIPDSGHVAIDRKGLDQSNRPHWQARIAYVPQTTYLLDASVLQNIALGIPAAAIERERVVAAAKLAQLDEFVDSLPNGYEHQLGERGVRLSGGQRQRVGLARALYSDASVLILDEATNALDGLTEQELIATLLRLRGRYTILLVAHRLSTLRACDIIFEMDHGRITASGSYAELLGNSASFRRLAEVQ